MAAAVLLAATGAPWRALEPGIEHRSDTRDGVTVEALRIDPRAHRIEVVLATEIGEKAATARAFAAATHAKVVVNGGFFDPALRPVGLRMSGGKKVAGQRSETLGALAVTDRGIAIVPGTEIAGLEGVRELVQCGPRLVVAGSPNRLKPQISRRTVAGVDRAGRLVLLVTREGAYEASALGRLLADPESEGGYGLVDALNLDGGGSTQLHAEAGGTIIDVGGATGVADALVVRARTDAGETRGSPAR